MVERSATTWMKKIPPELLAKTGKTADSNKLSNIA